MSQTFNTREEWLNAALALVRAQVPAIGSQRIRITCGFPSTYTRSGTLAECWPSDASKDNTWEVMISPTVALPVEVFTLVAGMALHTVPGGASRTSNSYRAACMDIGLAPADESWRTLLATDDFWSTFGDALEDLGPYPHAEVMAAQKKTQSTRMLKLTCPLCGYTLRTSAKWIAQGLPVCHDGTEFQAETTEESAE
tara:strand:- start:832 stop:1422 length:591 start_codon:yes stop_codon:yes gene_type:complete